MKLAEKRVKILKLLKLSKTKKRNFLLFWLTKQLDSQLISKISKNHIELTRIDIYLKKLEQEFNEEWKSYEKDLQQYLKVKEYKDWICTWDEEGSKIWTNIQTNKKSSRHPGIDSFEQNWRYLFQQALEEWKK